MNFHLEQKLIKFFPLREFYNDLNRLESQDAISGEYGGWSETSHPGFSVVKDDL